MSLGQMRQKIDSALEAYCHATVKMDDARSTQVAETVFEAAQHLRAKEKELNAAVSSFALARIDQIRESRG